MRQLIFAIEEITYVQYRFYASSQKNPYPPTRGKSHLYKAKLTQLSDALPSRLTNVIERTYQNIEEAIYRVPQVLTHSDLSNINILVNPDSSHLTSVVDQADASIKPFGIALQGLESVLSYYGPHRQAYYEDNVSHSRGLFSKILLIKIRGIDSDETYRAIKEVRTLRLLLRYGFRQEYSAEELTRDTTLLEVYLQSKSQSGSKYKSFVNSIKAVFLTNQQQPFADAIVRRSTLHPILSRL